MQSGKGYGVYIMPAGEVHFVNTMQTGKASVVNIMPAQAGEVPCVNIMQTGIVYGVNIMQAREVHCGIWTLRS